MLDAVMQLQENVVGDTMDMDVSQITHLRLQVIASRLCTPYLALKKRPINVLSAWASFSMTDIHVFSTEWVKRALEMPARLIVQ